MPKHLDNSYTRKQLITGSIICAIGAFFYCYEFILRIIPGILQEEIRAALGNISASTFGQISALYYFAYSPMQMPVGILMDRFGPRYLLSLACFCCTIGSLLFSYPSIMFASTGRFLIGFGSSFAFVGVLTAAVNWLPKRYFSLLAGLMTTLSMLGLVYGEIKITHVAHLMGLHSVLLMAVFMGVILNLLIFGIVRDAPRKQIQRTQAYIVFFKQVLQILQSRDIWIIGIIGACLYTSLSVFGELWGKSFLETSFHLSPHQAAKTLSMLFLGWAVGAPLCGYLSDHSGRRLLPLVIGASGAFICISIILWNPQLSYSALNSLVFIYGLFSSVEIIIFIMAKEYCKTKELSGTIFAVTNMIVSLGGMLFQPLVGTLLDRSSHHIATDAMQVYTASDYRTGLCLLPIAMIIVIIITILLGLRNAQPSKSSRS